MELNNADAERPNLSRNGRMKKRYVQQTGLIDYAGTWLSPMPFEQDCGVLGIAMPYRKTEEVLSILAGQSYSYQKLCRIFKFIMLLAVVILWLPFLVSIFFLSFYDLKIAGCIFLGTHTFIVIIFSPFLLYRRLQTLIDLPIFFHRQRRETLFLRRNSKTKQTDYLIVPWEEVLATTSMFTILSPYGGVRRAHLCIGGEDPVFPGRWWSKTNFISLNDGFSRLQWGIICRFMDVHPDHAFPGDAGLGGVYDLGLKYCWSIPDYVKEWCKPIPKEEWKEASVKLRWYNAYLTAWYVSGRTFLELNNIETSIGYPGDVEAKKQLAEGTLRPLRTGETLYPDLFAVAPPSPPTEPQPSLMEQMFGRPEPFKQKVKRIFKSMHGIE